MSAAAVWQAEAASHDSAARSRSVRNHFTAIVHRDGSLFELDGRKSTPINCGPTTAATFLKDALAQVQKRFVQVCKEGEQFVLFALAPAGGGAGAAAAGGGGGGALELTSSADLDPAAVQELMMFGFPEDAVRAALKQTGGNKEAAANRLLG